MTRVEIDWPSAEVHDGELVVGLSEPASARWRRRFEAVLPLLQQGSTRVDEVRAKKKRLVVRGVEEGSESDVRLLLESLVREANAGEPSEDPTPNDPTTSDADERMAAAFRAFGEQQRAEHEPERAGR